MFKKALIAGITGQDGSYLAEFLLQKGFVWVSETHTCKPIHVLEKMLKSYEGLYGGV